jgi:hypothetical protein
MYHHAALPLAGDAHSHSSAFREHSCCTAAYLKMLSAVLTGGRACWVLMTEML